MDRRIVLHTFLLIIMMQAIGYSGPLTDGALRSVGTAAHDPMPPPRILPKMLECTGKYGSNPCVVWFYFNHCHNWIQIKWMPMNNPGTDEWADKYRNYCSILWGSQNNIEERKLPPAKCDALMEQIRKGVREFPEMPIDWNENRHVKNTKKLFELKPGKRAWDSEYLKELYTPCAYNAFALTGGRDGVLYARELSSKAKDLSTFALRFEDVAGCELEHTRKGRTMRCPVLHIPVMTWLRGFLSLTETSLVINHAE